ncbi:MAG: flagellar motor switch protein FliN [Tepidisphaeraceae bacterium]
MAEEQAAASVPEDPAPRTIADVSSDAGSAASGADPLADAVAAGGADANADQAAIDELLKQASFEDASAVAAPGSTDGAAASAAPLPDADQFELPNFNQVIQDAQVSSIDLLRDVELNVKIELGRSRMLVEDVLKLGEGSVVELDKLAGDPVDVFVNDRLVARGEVLVLNDNFCVRVNEIVAGVKEEGM